MWYEMKSLSDKMEKLEDKIGNNNSVFDVLPDTDILQDFVNNLPLTTEEGLLTLETKLLSDDHFKKKMVRYNLYN